MNTTKAALKIKDNSDAAIKIGQIIWKKTPQTGDRLKGLSVGERTFLAVEIVQGQVDNGGFDQFFFNSSGNYTAEALEALKTIGAKKTAKILADAIALFPGKTFPIKQSDRRKTMKSLGRKVSDGWSKLDQKFYKNREDVDALKVAYVRNNIELFGE